MTWVRWLPATARFLLLVCLGLPPWGMLRAEGTLKEVPFDRKLLAGTDLASESFGSVLAVSGDVLVAGAPSAAVNGKSSAGAVYIFVRDPASGAWVERKRLVAQDGAAFDFFGSVGINGDTVVVGASRARVGGVFQQGAAYVFERHAGGNDNWGQTAKLTDDSVGSIAWFGSSVAIQGDLLAVGAPRGNPSGLVLVDNGSVTIFERDRGGPGAWGKVATIPPPVGGGNVTSLESFGNAVAIDGDLLLVGAATADVSYFGEDDGAAYVFRRDPVDRDRWGFVTRLTAPEATLCPGERTLFEVPPESRAEVQSCALREDNRTDHDVFGSAVAINGDTLVIGAPLAEAATGAVVGAAYVFRRDPAGTDRWDQIAKLTGSDILASTEPAFGSSLALVGGNLLVGAPRVEVGTKPDQGAAYLFERGAGGADAWGEVARFVAADGLNNEHFGSAVALDGGNGIIGANAYQEDEMTRGAVYLAGDPPPEVAQEPAFPPTGELVNDGIVEGPAGVLLGILGTALAEPLPVWIHEVPPPAEPLSSMMRPVGAFYNVGAGRTTSMPSDAPFGLALPIPAGADTAHMGMAVLTAAEPVLEGPWDSWTPVLGYYNPETNLFSFAVPALFVEGSYVVLIEDPDLAPLSEEAPALRRSGHVLLDVPPGPKFAIECLHNNFTDPSKCQPDDQLRMDGHLQAAHDDYVSLGYGLPALLRHGYKITTSPTGMNGFNKVTVIFYTAVFASEFGFSDKICNKIFGEYLPSRQLLMICYDRAINDDQLKTTSRHELFHSFQWASTKFAKDGTLPKNYKHEQLENFQWIHEGTANAAEESSGPTMHRNKLNVPHLHPINRSLVASDAQPTKNAPTPPITNIAYSAQDFFVYFGNKQGLGLGYLKELFTRGASPEAADAFFKDVHNTSLAEQYWGWVKNQAIEKGPINLDGALPGPVCSIEFPRDSPVVGTPRSQFSIPTPLSFPTLTFPTFEGPVFAEGTLGRLTAKLVKIDIIRDVGAFTVKVIRPEGGPVFPEGDLAYKVYVNAEDDCANKVKDGQPRTFDNGLGANSMVYIVIANTQHKSDSRVGYRVEVNLTP